jgi:hypothetical protein
MWDWIIFEYCKVNFLCYAGDPNWLGAIILLLLFGAILYMIWRVAIFLTKFIHGRLGNPSWREYLDTSFGVFGALIGVLFGINLFLWLFWGLPFWSIDGN